MKSVSVGETRLPLRLLDQLLPFPAVRRPSAESRLHGVVRLLPRPDVCTRETSKWSGPRTSGHAEFPPQTQQDSNDEKLSSGKESTFN